MKIRQNVPNITDNYGATLLHYRGVKDVNEYINPGKEYLHKPELLDNIDKGANLLNNILDENKQILLIIDSDTDGYTSASIIYQYIKKIKPEAKIKYRIHEAKQHGLEDHIEWILDNAEHIDLIIIPDAGSNNYDYCMQLDEIGIKILCIDHHLLDKQVAPNMILINNQTSLHYPNKELTGAGVTWQFCRYCDKIWGYNYADDLIDLAALGICGDMGSMLDMENRYIIKNGFSHIKNYFFKSFIEKQDYSMGGEITPITVAFYIVPMINAMIRVGSMSEKERLFLAFIDGHQMVPCNKRGAKGTFEEVAIESIRECTNARSHQNKDLDKMEVLIEQKILENNLLDNKILFIKLEEEDEFSSTLNGLLAMRLTAKYKKPTIVARINNEGYVRGSMRGINQSALESFKDFLENSGYFEYIAGHANAAGCSLKDSDINKLHNYANEKLKNYNFNENYYDVDFTREANSSDLADIIFDLDNYHTLYGQNINEPLIYVKNIKFTKNDIKIMGRNSDTVKIEKNGISYMKFHAKDFIKDLERYEDFEMEIVGRANLNAYGGRYTPQIFIDAYELKDGRFSF